MVSVSQLQDTIQKKKKYRRDLFKRVTINTTYCYARLQIVKPGLPVPNNGSGCDRVTDGGQRPEASRPTPRRRAPHPATPASGRRGRSQQPTCLRPRGPSSRAVAGPRQDPLPEEAEAAGAASRARSPGRSGAVGGQLELRTAL